MKKGKIKMKKRLLFFPHLLVVQKVFSSRTQKDCLTHPTLETTALKDYLAQSKK